MLFNWRFDLVFGTAAIVLALIYLAGVYRLRRRGGSWPARRTCSWVFGCIAMLFVTSSGLGSYMSAMFSMHMRVQLVMAMFVPILLVLGTPVTLALRALRTSGDDAAPGPREWLLSALHSSLARFLTVPGTALLLFVVSGYGLYLTGAFDIVVADHATHVLMTGCWLVTGAVFFWVVIGVEPSPHRASLAARTVTAIAGLLPWVWVGIVVRERQDVMGESFYRSLRLEWHTDLLADQRLGGGIISLGAAAALLIVLIVLFLSRNRHWRKVNRRSRALLPTNAAYRAESRNQRRRRSLRPTVSRSTSSRTDGRPTPA